MFNQRRPLYNQFKSLKCGIYTIEGIIGVGKTTLGRSLERLLNDNDIETKFFPEYVNKELLDQYIGDMGKYAYSFQMIMLCKRIETYRQAEVFASKGGVALIDRSIIGDMTFARMQKDNGNFTQSEFDIYLSLMKQDIQLVPTASIFLRCSPEIAIKRIMTRGIEAEINGYSIEYLKQLYNAYEKSVAECDNVKHIMIDWDDGTIIKDGYLTQDVARDILNKFL